MVEIWELLSPLLRNFMLSSIHRAGWQRPKNTIGDNETALEFDIHRVRDVVLIWAGKSLSSDTHRLDGLDSSAASCLVEVPLFDCDVPLQCHLYCKGDFCWSDSRSQNKTYHLDLSWVTPSCFNKDCGALHISSGASLPSKHAGIFFSLWNPQYLPLVGAKTTFLATMPGRKSH